MNYLLNNIEVEIDIEKSDNFNFSIWFKVQNKKMHTYWSVEHTLDEIEAFCKANFNEKMPIEIEQRYEWLQTICTKINEDKERNNIVLEFFKSKPQIMRKKSKKRSLSTFSQLLKQSIIEENRSQSRNTLSQKQKCYTQIILQSEARFCDLRTDHDFKELLTLLEYREIKRIGQGTQSSAFKALNQEDHLVAVKISHNTPENVQAALTQRLINQDVPDAFIGNYLFQYQILEVEDILIIEEELAQKTLEDMIQEKSQHNEKFTQDEINQIMKDLVDQIYNLHIHRQSAHNDIKPENILINEGKFILHDYGVVKYVPKGSEQIEVNQILGTPIYFSPIKFQHFQSLDNINIDRSITQSIITVSNDYKHNPFKSDIYSLGLVLLRLFLNNNNIVADTQIQQLYFNDRIKQLPLMIQKYKYFIYSETFFFFDEMRRLKPLLELMLENDEQQRISTIELAALYYSSICAPLQTQFQSQFKIYSKPIDNNNFQVAYCLKSLFYEGGYNPQKQERINKGTMYKTQKNELLQVIQYYKKEKKKQIHSDDDQNIDMSSITQLQESKSQTKLSLQVLYEGMWEKSIPHGQGKLNLYNIVSDLTYRETLSDLGKIINKCDEHHEEYQFSIESCFFYGLLNQKTKINNEINQFCLNISQRLTSNEFEIEQKYYLFLYDDHTNQYYGKEEFNDFCVIDIRNIFQKEIIKKIIRSFISNLKNRIKQFELQNNIDGKQIMMKDYQDNIIYILFKPSIQNTNQKIIKQEQRRKTSTCCVSSKKVHQFSKDFIEIEVLSDEQETFIVTELLQEQKSYLSELILKSCSLSEQSIKSLFLDNNISHITSLNLSYSMITDTMISQLLDSEFVTMVRELDLSSTQMSTQTIKSMINSSNLNSVFKLQVANCAQCITFDDYLQCDKAQKLVFLNLSGNRWVDKILLKLLDPIYLPNLQNLDLSNTSLNQKDIQKFQSKPYGQKIQLISNQQKNQFQTFQFVQKHYYSMFENIKNLIRDGFISNEELQENSIMIDKTLKRISYSSGLQNVDKINLSSQPHITSLGLKQLFQSQYIVNLISLNLSDTSINGEVLKYLEQSKINHLKTLILRNCHKLKYEDLKAFAKSYRTASLTKLYINSRLIQTKELVSELKSMPNLQKIEIIFNQSERQKDLSDIITLILTWITILISRNQLQKFTMDLCDCNVQKGIQLFVNYELSVLQDLKCTCAFKFYIKNAIIDQESLAKLREPQQNISITLIDNYLFQ